MKLYDMGAAPNPRRVRMFLAEKGIAIERVEIDIPSGANLQPAYLTINPRGVLPALQLDDGSVIDESVAICRYFEGLHPEPNLFGIDAREAGAVEMWSRRCEFEGMAAIASVFRNSSPAFADRAAPGGGAASPQIPALVERGKNGVARFFAMLEARLAESPYLAGDRFTVADITGLVTVDFAKWIKVRVPEENAATLKWYDAVSGRPSAKA